MQNYIMSGSESKDLVRTHYANHDDVFDAVSYNKGGRILHMLRNYVGDSAFFKSLNNYLITNKFKSGEAANLRLAFEETTGKDLNWFWNQWYYGSGHPKLKINYSYDDAAGKALVTVEQTQKSGKIFQLPIAVDVYNGANKVRYNVWLKNKIDTLVFPYTSKPDLINVDADKILLAEKTDNKSEENAIAQWKYAKLYIDRKEAIDFFAKKSMPELAKGLYDKAAGIRQLTIQKIAASPYKSDPVVLSTIEDIAKKDFDKKTKAAAIKFLVRTADKKYEALYTSNVTDSSYSVAGAALEGLVATNPENAYALAKQYGTGAKDALSDVVMDVIIKNGTVTDFEVVSGSYRNTATSDRKVRMTEKYSEYLLKINDVAQLKKGIDDIMQFRNAIPEQYRSFVDPMFKKSFDALSKAKGTEVENYIQQVFK